MAESYPQLEDLQAWLDHDLQPDEPHVQLALSSAVAKVEGHCGRSFAKDDDPTPRAFRASNSLVIRTDDIATAVGLTVRVDRDRDGVYEDELSSSQYFTYPPQIEMATPDSRVKPITEIRAAAGTYFPIDPNQRPLVQVTATWGYPTVPDDVFMAVLILASRLFKRRYSPNGFVNDSGFGAVPIGYTDPDVKTLLDPYRLMYWHS